MKICSLIVAVALFAPTSPCHDWPREMLPHPTVYRMANVAHAIVEGTVGPGGRVAVQKRFFVEQGAVIGDTIMVSSLAKMPLQENGVLGVLGGRPVAIDPDSVLLFLVQSPGGWVPMHLINGAARGVLWFAGEGVWGYAQSMNPGPYSLTRWQFHSNWRRRGEVAIASPKEVRDAVALGVVARGKWRATLRIRDRGERAKAVARWFSPSTSPDGEWWQERVWPDLMKASDDTGESMVKPLARIVQVDGSPDAVVAACSALGRLGNRAREATPSMIARLRDPRSAAPIHMVRALRRLADPRAVDVLRDFVSHVDPFVAAEAGAALHLSGGAEAGVLLAKRLPSSGDDGHTVGAIAALLEALHDIDPTTAERLVRERFLDLDQLMMQRPWLRRLGRSR